MFQSVEGDICLSLVLLVWATGCSVPAHFHMNKVQHLWQKHSITAPLCPRESPALSLLNNYSSPSWLAGTLMSVCVLVCVRHWYLSACLFHKLLLLRWKCSKATCSLSLSLSLTDTHTHHSKTLQCWITDVMVIYIKIYLMKEPDEEWSQHQCCCGGSWQ